VKWRRAFGAIDGGTRSLPTIFNCPTISREKYRYNVLDFLQHNISPVFMSYDNMRVQRYKRSSISFTAFKTLKMYIEIDSISCFIRLLYRQSIEQNNDKVYD